jgi:hypothetical protein
VLRDRGDRWRELLLRYESPAPTPDFVGRARAPPTPAADRPSGACRDRSRSAS